MAGSRLPAPGSRLPAPGSRLPANRLTEHFIRGFDPEVTLGGYMEKHDRAAAFGGRDGQAYSVGIWIDDMPDNRGLYGAAILFVQWSPGGDRPVGHVETDYLAWGATPAEAEQRIKALSLFDVKAALDQAIAERPPEW